MDFDQQISANNELDFGVGKIIWDGHNFWSSLAIISDLPNHSLPTIIIEAPKRELHNVANNHMSAESKLNVGIKPTSSAPLQIDLS